MRKVNKKKSKNRFIILVQKKRSIDAQINNLSKYVNSSRTKPQKGKYHGTSMMLQGAC